MEFCSEWRDVFVCTGADVPLTPTPSIKVLCFLHCVSVIHLHTNTCDALINIQSVLMLYWLITFSQNNTEGVWSLWTNKKIRNLNSHWSGSIFTISRSIIHTQILSAVCWVNWVFPAGAGAATCTVRKTDYAFEVTRTKLCWKSDHFFWTTIGSVSEKYFIKQDSESHNSILVSSESWSQNCDLVS